MSGELEIFERLRQVEKDTALNGQKMDQIEKDLERIELQKLDPMVSQVSDLHDTMTRQKGFWAGIFLMAGAVWTAVAGLVAATWKIITGAN